MDVRIAENIAHVQARINEACHRSGRDPSEVKLVAVSKSQGVEKIRAAYEYGLRDFGENRVYEALPKMENLGDLDGICWHMVGHIQSRKACDVVPGFAMVHSVDRLKIAKRLSRYAGEADIHLSALLECNVSGEETKEGWMLTDHSSWNEIVPLFKQITALDHLKILGLMTMAPWTEDEQILRHVFRTLRELNDYLEEKIPGCWRELSMGMTDDFEIAVEEGSTIVRIGRAIFGPREGE